MAYTKTNWVDSVTVANATNMNKIETGIEDAHTDITSKASTTYVDDRIHKGFKNYIINGGFDVSQRGDYTTAISATNNTYYLDRFYAFVSVVTANI